MTRYTRCTCVTYWCVSVLFCALCFRESLLNVPCFERRVKILRRVFSGDLSSSSPPGKAYACMCVFACERGDHGCLAMLDVHFDVDTISSVTFTRTWSISRRRVCHQTYECHGANTSVVHAICFFSSHTTRPSKKRLIMAQPP